MPTRPQPVTITLGEKSFTIRPMTCRQVQAADAFIEAADGLKKIDVAKALGIIKIAVSRDYPNVDVDDVEALPNEIYAAVTAILRLLGGEAEPSLGEAMPAAATA